MRPQMKEPLPVAAGAAQDTALNNTNNTTSDALLQACGKQVAMWLFNIGANTLGATDAAFERHPSWATA